MATVYQGAVAMSATAGLGISELALIPSDATIPGDATVPGAATYVTEDAAGDPNAGGGQRFVAFSGLVAGAGYTGASQAPLTGVSTLSEASAQTMLVVAPLSAVTGLAEAPWMIYRVTAAALVGATTLATPARTTMVVAMAFAPASALALGPTSRTPVSAPAFTASTALVAGAAVTAKGTVSAFLGAMSTLGPAGLHTAVASATFAGTSGLTAPGRLLAYTATTLTGAGVLGAGIAYTAQVTALLAGTGTLVTTGIYVGVAGAALAAVSTLSPHALATYYLHTVPTLTGVAGLSSAGHFEWYRSVTLSATAELAPALGVRVRIAIVALSATTGLEVEAWVHTLIPPGFTPAPIVTVDTTPIWHLYIADTITGKVAYELPVISQQWESKLNNIGTAQATINVEQAYRSIAAWDERDPRVLFRQFLSGPLRYSGVFAYGDQAVWAGPLGPVSVPGDSAQIQIGFSEFSYLFTKRLMLGDRIDPVGNGDLSFGPTTIQQIALDIILQAAAPGSAPYGLPANLTNPLPTGGDNTVIRTYYGFDFNTVWDALAALTAEVNGPDIRFDPQLSYRSDGLYLSYGIQIGSPLIYSDTVWAWDVPANATVAWDTNMQNFATTYWGIGAGQDRTKLALSAENPTLYDLGFPALEMSDSLHSSVTDPFQLQALVDGDMLMYQQPAIKWTVKVQGSRDPYIGSFRVGDIFLVTVQDHPAVPDGTYRRRITGLSGDQTDWVSVLSADAYSVIATTMEGVQVITSQ